MQKSGNRIICKEYGPVSRECQELQKVKDATYHKEKMLLCKQEEAGVQLNAEQADWKDDTDDESEEQELEAHYMYMGQISCGDTNITIDSSDICYDRAQDDQDETDDLDQERDLLASLIQKLKCEFFDATKKRNKFLETSNKALVDNIESFAKPEFLKKAQRANPRLYDIGSRHSQISMELKKHSFCMKSDRLFKGLAYYADHMNAILGVYTDLDEVTNLQCDYVETWEKCKHLEKELSKSRTMSKSFEALQKHAINLELDLQQYLKAQLQDKGIAISELKKLIEKMKGKYVETKFEKSSVIRQPNAFKSQRQSILGKPAIFSDSLAKKDFSKSKPVTTQNVSNDFSKPVTAQILPQNMLPIVKNTNVIALGMYKVHTKPNQTRTPQLHQDIRKPNKCVSFSTGVIPTTSVSRPQPKSNQLEDRVMSNNSQGKEQKVEDHRRNFKFSNNKTSLVEIILFIFDSGCSKHMTENLKLLTNFVEKFLGTVKFGNDQIAPILGYRDPVQGTITIKRVYYVEGLNHNLFSVGQFFDADLEVAFRKSICYIRDLKGNDLLTEGIRHETSTARTPEQNGVVERRNRTLVEAARTMLSAAKVPLFFWAEAIATTCFTQNRSLVIPRHEKTPYHIINARKPSVKFFHIFGSLCYIVRDGENLDKMKEKGDACIFVGYSTQSRAYRVFNKRTRIIVETIHVNFDELPQMASDHVSSDPVPQCPTTVLEQRSLSPDLQSQENVPPVAETVSTSNELELLYSLMFNELLNGTPPVVSKSSTVHAG
ncbi:retrovirus-related pol polyprotein from transposon TNT 1-94 [Tanacetum coccineum]